METSVEPILSPVSFINGPPRKRILITGAAGSIGSELYRQLVLENTLMALDINETGLFDLHEEYRLKGHDVHYRLGDIRDLDVVLDVFKKFKPDLVFHAAALKHVTPSEVYPRETVRTNVLGTLNVVAAAQENGVERLVYVSTDKVINSHSVMGVSKRLGELIARNAGYIAVRFGNVMRSRGSVLEIWERQIARGESITITDERMERFMMTIPDACELLIKASEIGEGGQVLVMDMGTPIRIVDLAKKFLEEHGKPDHPISFIGIRPGEALTEMLMTPEEEARAVKINNFYLI